MDYNVIEYFKNEFKLISKLIEKVKEMSSYISEKAKKQVNDFKRNLSFQTGFKMSKTELNSI